MSVTINGNKITMTRGDTLRVTVGMFRDGEEYTPSVGDTLRFALKTPKFKDNGGNYKDDEPLILKDIPISTRLLSLDPEDTKSLKFGKYVYDIQITFADGTVDTFITTEDFKLTPEVE